MSQKDRIEFEVGGRVRLRCDCAGSQAGEEGKIIKVKRDERGEVVSLDIMIDANPQTTRGTTVYPREIEPIA